MPLYRLDSTPPLLFSRESFPHEPQDGAFEALRLPQWTAFVSNQKTKGAVVRLRASSSSSPPLCVACVLRALSLWTAEGALPPPSLQSLMESEEAYEKEGSGSRRARNGAVLWTRVGREQGMAVAVGHVVALPYAKSGGGALLLAMVQEAEQQAETAAMARHTADAGRKAVQQAEASSAAMARHTADDAGRKAVQEAESSAAAIARHTANAQAEAGAEPEGGGEAQAEPGVATGPGPSPPSNVLVLGEATKVAWVTAPNKRSSQASLGASEDETVERIARRLGVGGGLGHRAAAFGTAQGLLLVGASGTGKVSESQERVATASRIFRPSHPSTVRFVDDAGEAGGRPLWPVLHLALGIAS